MQRKSDEWVEFDQRMAATNTAPLWESLARIVPPAPQPVSEPAIWRYQEMRPLLMESGRLITAREAERRVIMLENPALRGQSRITQSLYAGLQLVMPGETTSNHRHAASALRFIVEGAGAYTTVEGAKIAMQPGDFILTPSWTFHDHGNPGDEPVVWLDGLDIPIVNMFDASFAEQEHTGEIQKADTVTPSLFSYPYTRSRETLDRLYRFGPVDERHGVRLQYVSTFTIGAALQFFPAGFAGTSARATDGTVYCVVEGEGSTQIGETTFAWREHDVFVAPSWYPVAHRASTDAVLFSFSDRPAQKALGLWREDLS